MVTGCNHLQTGCEAFPSYCSFTVRNVRDNMTKKSSSDKVNEAEGLYLLLTVIQNPLNGPFSYQTFKLVMVEKYRFY